MSFFKPWENGNKAAAISETCKTRMKNENSKTKKLKKDMDQKMENLGRLKISIFNNELDEFVTIFSKIKNVQLREVNELNKNINIDSKAVVEIKNHTIEAVDIGKALLAGTAAGGFAGFAALGSVTAFGAASTGTAIAGLSGAAASNALLAWFGGGALAAGGYGMAGGAFVVGGVFAAPALIIAPFVWDKIGTKKLEDAKKMEAQVKKAVGELHVAQNLIAAILQRSELLINTIEHCKNNFEEFLILLNELVENEKDFNNYSQEEKLFVGNTILMAKLLMNIIEMPVVNEQGKLARNKKSINASLKEIDNLANDSSTIVKAA